MLTDAVQKVNAMVSNQELVGPGFVTPLSKFKAANSNV